jgi:diketogulonate reductase-like aldo/keto reductase
MDAQSTVTLSSGRCMPVLGLGTWELTDDTANVIAQALELGYRMIDTASDYGTQPAIGDAVRHSGVDRAQVFLVDKVEEDEDAYAAAGRYLRELGLEHADLTILHRPPQTGAGRELWEGLLRARQDGLAGDVGVSNYSTDQIDELIEATGEVPAVNQIEWSPFGWSPQMLDYCREHGIVVQAYSPLTRTDRLDDPRLVEIAAAHDKSAAQVVLRWHLQLGVVPLPKANRQEHLRENLDVFDFELSDDHMSGLSDLNEHYSALGALPYV